MLNASPSECVAENILIVVHRHERQSAALLCAPDIHLKVMLYVASSSIHLKVMLYVASSNPHLLTLLFAFLYSEILPVACGHFLLLFQLLEGSNSTL